MRTTTIYARNGWTLTSHGNGWAYLLEFSHPNGSKSSAWFQDDDAEAFRANTTGEDGFFVNHVEERFADYSDVMLDAASMV